MLAHRALGLPGGARGEVDVGELVGHHINSEIALGIPSLVCQFDEERLDPGQRLDRLIEHARAAPLGERSEEHTSELQSLAYLVCRLLLEKKKYGKVILQFGSNRVEVVGHGRERAPDLHSLD